jgi:protein gp37
MKEINWDPWRGCLKYSRGCDNCFIYSKDRKRGRDTSQIIRKDEFYKPILKDLFDEYVIPANTLVWLCFASDFFLKEADQYRDECFEIIRKRPDLNFHFLTKRIARYKDILPTDFAESFKHLNVGVSCVDQRAVDERILYLIDAPFSYKAIVLAPLIGPVNLDKYLSKVDAVVVGGEVGYKARKLDFDWLFKIYQQCRQTQTAFELRYLGSHFIINYQRVKLSKFEVMEALANKYQALMV